MVRIRERDWVVLPSDDTDIVCLRPLSGSESEICGIHREIEGHALKHAEFAPPKPEQAGDFIAGKLLRNAARLGLRNGAGPFRSLGRLSVRPRPYQFVPLIMALKLDFVRSFRSLLGLLNDRSENIDMQQLVVVLVAAGSLLL